MMSDQHKYMAEDLKGIFERYFEDNQYRQRIIGLADFAEGTECGLEIDYNHMESYFIKGQNADILDIIFTSPVRILEAMEKAIETQLHSDQKNRIQIHPRILNLPSTRELRVSEIKAKHIGQLMRFSGRIKKIRMMTPKIILGAFKCLRCGKVIQEQQPMDNFEVKEPLECYKDQDGCKRTRYHTSWELLPELSKFRNLQIVFLEEAYNPDNPHQPQTKRVFLWDDLVGIFLVNNIVVNCIVKTFRTRKTSTPEIYLEAVSCEFPDDYYRTVTLSEQDKEKILDLMHSDDIYEMIVDSIAPTIRGHREIKLAIALALFRGVDKEIDDTYLRGKPHICIVGDPSTAKSKMLQYVERLAPRAIYGSGEGASGVGLTYALVKDEIDKSWAIEMGILPLANDGVAIIDEIDKMSKEDRERLHTAMESGILPVAKAGIVQTLHADCSLIVGGNPKRGRFDPYTPLITQIDLPPPLLSRFDLIFAIEDKCQDSDSELADYILNIHMRWKDDNYIVPKPPIGPDLFKKMVFFAWEYLKPELTEEASDIFKAFFKDLRGVNQEEEKTVPVSWRQLEGLIRLAEAAAKIRGSNSVDKKDAALVIDLVKSSLYASCYENGLLDFDLQTTGYRRGQRERLQLLIDFIRQADGTTTPEIIEFGQTHGIDEDVCKTDITKLTEEGVIFLQNGLYRPSTI